MLIKAMLLCKCSTTFRADMSFLSEKAMACSLLEGRSQAADVGEEAVIPHMKSHVQCETFSTSKRLSTLLADLVMVRRLVWVGMRSMAAVVGRGQATSPDVEEEGSFLEELLPTSRTRVGDTSMLPFVFNQLELTQEPSTAVRTDVWL